MITRNIFVIGTICVLVSSSLSFVNAVSMSDSSKKPSGNTKGKQSAEAIAKREEIKKKFEALNKKLKDAGTAINKISDFNTKAALKNIHEYLTGIAELSKKGAEHMKGFMDKKDGKGRPPMDSTMAARKNEGFPPSQDKEDDDAN